MLGSGRSDTTATTAATTTAAAAAAADTKAATNGEPTPHAEGEFVVEGELVALGPLRMDLAPTYQRWANDVAAFNANGGAMVPWTLEAERERLAGRIGKPSFADFTVYDRSDQAPVGFTTLFRVDHRTGTAEFGILMGERRDRGLGTEATRLTLDWGFMVMGLHNIMLGVAGWNARAIHVYAKTGFREVGRRRGAVVTMGRRYDAVYMDMLAEEFLDSGASVLARHTPTRTS